MALHKRCSAFTTLSRAKVIKEMHHKITSVPWGTGSGGVKPTSGGLCHTHTHNITMAVAAWGFYQSVFLIVTHHRLETVTLATLFDVTLDSHAQNALHTATLWQDAVRPVAHRQGIVLVTRAVLGLTQRVHLGVLTLVFLLASSWGTKEKWLEAKYNIKVFYYSFSLPFSDTHIQCTHSLVCLSLIAKLHPGMQHPRISFSRSHSPHRHWFTAYYVVKGAKSNWATLYDLNSARPCEGRLKNLRQFAGVPTQLCLFFYHIP